MDTTIPVNGGAPPAELNTLLERLLDEAEGGPSPEAVQPATPPPPPPAAADSPTPPQTVAADAVPAGAPAFPLGSLLANPALLAALPTLAENLGPLLGSASGGTGSAPRATRPHTVDRHTALLCAVKPYLSPQRQSAAETVIRLCRIWDALERSGISLSGLLSGLGSTPAGSSARSDGEVT